MKLKMKISTYYTVCVFLSGVMSFNVTADESIVQIYQNNVTRYNESIAAQDYVGAEQVAIDLLNMDPSDTLSFLRFAYAAKQLNRVDNQLADSLLRGVSRGSEQDKDMMAIAEAMLQSISKPLQQLTDFNLPSDRSFTVRE